MLFVKKSQNRKTGPIPVTYSPDTTCPDNCGLKKSGVCYAKHGPTGMVWRKVKDTWAEGLASIRALPDGTLWRHNVAGDLPGENNAIDTARLSELVSANAGKRGFTYTHKPMTPENLAAVKEAVANGFTINLSADNLHQADTLWKAGLPVVVLLPHDAPAKLLTPDGHTVQVCPAVTGTRANCAECGACQSSRRQAIIGFPAHGVRSKAGDAIAMEV